MTTTAVDLDQKKDTDKGIPSVALPRVSEPEKVEGGGNSKRQKRRERGMPLQVVRVQGVVFRGVRRLI